MARIQNVAMQFSARDTNVQRTLKGIQQSTKRTSDAASAMNRRFTQLGQSLRRFAGVASAGLLVAGAVRITRSFAQQRGELERLAGGYGTTNSALERFSFALRNAINFEGGFKPLERLLLNVNRAIAEGIRGSTRYVEVFDSLQLRAQDLARLDPLDAAQQIIGGLASSDVSEAERFYAAYQTLGPRFTQQAAGLFQDDGFDRFNSELARASRILPDFNDRFGQLARLVSDNIDDFQAVALRGFAEGVGGFDGFENLDQALISTRENFETLGSAIVTLANAVVAVADFFGRISSAAESAADSPIGFEATGLFGYALSRFFSDDEPSAEEPRAAALANPIVIDRGALQPIADVLESHEFFDGRDLATEFQREQFDVNAQRFDAGRALLDSEVFQREFESLTEVQGQLEDLSAEQIRPLGEQFAEFAAFDFTFGMRSALERSLQTGEFSVSANIFTPFAQSVLGGILDSLQTAANEVLARGFRQLFSGLFQRILGTFGGFGTPATAHSGTGPGGVQGARGTPVPMVLLAGETVRTYDQERTLQRQLSAPGRGGSGGNSYNVNVNGTLSENQRQEVLRLIDDLNRRTLR